MDGQYICKFCGRTYNSSQQLGGHIVYCKNNPNRQNIINKRSKKRYPTFNYTLNCIVCNASYTLELTEKNYNDGQYTKTCCKSCASKLSSLNCNKSNKNNKISKTLKGRALTNDAYFKRYGHTRHQVKYCTHCNRVIPESRGSSKYCSDYCRKTHMSNVLSEKLKGKTGGYRTLSGSKKHKSGKYDNIYFDSSWELAYYIYCKENNIAIHRCEEVRYYTYKNKVYKYYPDFVVDNEIIEIKGYVTDKAVCKMQQNPDIRVLYIDDIKPYLMYCINKYGKNFWEKFYKLTY